MTHSLIKNNRIVEFITSCSSLKEDQVDLSVYLQFQNFRISYFKIIISEVLKLIKGVL